MGRLEAKAAMLKKEFQLAIEKTAKQISLDLEDEYQKAVEKFYADYSPARYNRTFETERAYRRIFAGAASAGYASYRAGVEASASYISAGAYRADTDWVFKRTFVKGYHGYSYDEYEEWGERDSSINWFITWNPGQDPMSPTPHELMQSAVKRVKNRSYVAGLFGRYFHFGVM